jgi:hypothetical protein
MGFSSFDDLINEVTTNGKINRYDFTKTSAVTATIGRWYDMSLQSGLPVANPYTAETNNLKFRALYDTDGMGIWHGGNVSPDTKHLLNIGAFGNTTTSVPSVLQLVDVLGYYPITTVTTTTAQTLNNTVTLPRYVDGKGVRAYLVARVAMGAGTPTIQISYTNQDGVAGRITPVTVTAVTTAVAGHIVNSDPTANHYGAFLPLAAGDSGIRSIQSITLNATMTSGSLALVLCRPLTSLPITVLGVQSERNLVNQLPSMPQVFDGANLNFLMFTGAAYAAGGNITGYAEFANG